MCKATAFVFGRVFDLLFVIFVERGLVEETSASRATAEADNLFILDGEMVIVGDLITFVDDLLCVYDDLLAVTDR